jgi:predicted ABC-type transport system involved in lysophospholipase L1 biosynthesis ATPase subunit
LLSVDDCFRYSVVSISLVILLPVDQEGATEARTGRIGLLFLSFVLLATAAAAAGCLEKVPMEGVRFYS